jgi:D-alanyl-D-alanine carboxypeptidase/D-alanyl-D-alanine-endopeptidase (penicillin-binding protein 4)
MSACARLFAVWGCLAGLCPLALAQPDVSTRPDLPAAREVHEQLTALLAKLPARTQVGLVVEDVADGRRWFAHEPQTPLKPASVLKLFVTAAALERFGPEFRYRTAVYLHGGELWVVGAGDPALGDERLNTRDDHPLTSPFDQWADALLARGVRALEKIVVDDGVFDQQWRHQDWPGEQASTWYEAPVGGLNFNDNCLDARAEPHADRVNLVLRPDLPPSFFVTSLRVGRSHRPHVQRAAGSDVFELSGTLARPAQLGPISAGNPSVFFGFALKQALQTRGVLVRGDVVRRTITPEARAEAVLLTEQTTPLRDILWRCNTFSQNLFAECLLKSLAAYAPDGNRSGEPGSWEAGLRVLRATLAGIGVDVTGAVLRDGSGLSHNNRVTAEQVTRLLVRMHSHRHATAFVDSLAVPGRDGSMRHRYADPLLSGRLRGKTGTLAGVHALAGYARRPQGLTLAFALLCNDECDPELPAKVARILAGLEERRDQGIEDSRNQGLGGH